MRPTATLVRLPCLRLAQTIVRMRALSLPKTVMLESRVQRTRPRSPVAQLANKVNKTGTEYDVQAQQAGAHAPLPPGCVALTLVVSAVRHVHMQYSFPASCICQLAQWRF